jgi:alanyl-tRNA synthetase
MSNIISGSIVFKIVDTHGIPLATILHIINARGQKIDWYNFYKTAIDRNWNKRTVRSRIIESLIEVYGRSEDWNHKLDKLELLIEKSN